MVPWSSGPVRNNCGTNRYFVSDGALLSSLRTTSTYDAALAMTPPANSALDRKTLNWLLLAALVLAAAGFAAFFIDLPVADWVSHESLPGDLYGP